MFDAACLKDIQGFFRNDDPEERPAFFAVHKYNLARSDLVPLIVTYPEDYDIVYNARKFKTWTWNSQDVVLSYSASFTVECMQGWKVIVLCINSCLSMTAVKVCTFLTMASAEPGITVDPTKQAENMQQVCEAFLAQDALAVIVTLLAEPLSRHPKMTEKDVALTELVIIFLRNLLGATEPLPGASPVALENARRVRVGLVERLFSDSVLDLFLLIAQHARERPFKTYASVLLEFFLSLLTGTTPKSLLGAREMLETLRSQKKIEEASANRDGRHTKASKSRSSQIAAKKAAIFARSRNLGATRSPAIPSTTIGRTVTRFGPHSQQFAGAVYVRRHIDQSNPVFVRHNPNRTELPSIVHSNPRLAKAKRIDAEATLRASYAGGASEASTAINMQVDGKALGGANRSRSSSMTIATVGNIRDAELLTKLDDYLETFLKEAYTPLVGQVFKEARSGLGLSSLEEEEFERYVRFVAFCLQYIRLKEEKRQNEKKTKVAKDLTKVMKVDGIDEEKSNELPSGDTDDTASSPFQCVSATMGWDSFHLVQVLLQSAEAADAQRAKERPPPPPRPYVLLHSLCPLLREMLLALDLARVFGNEADQTAADRLQRRLLHDDSKESGLLPSLTKLMKSYSFQRHPRTYALNLVECLSLVLGTLDRLASDPGGFKVKQKAKRIPKRKKNKKRGEHEELQKNQEDNTVSIDNKIEGDQEKKTDTKGDDTEHLANGWMSGLTNKTTEEGLQNVENTAGEAGSGLELRKENDKSRREEEYDNKNNSKEAKDLSNNDNSDIEKKVAEEEEQDEEEEESSSEDEGPKYREVDIDLPRRLRAALAFPSLIQFHIWVLEGYKSNKPFTNHAIVSFLERIALPAPVGLGLEPMLWQLSVLRIFHSIMADNSVHKDVQYARLLKFCTRITRNLFARLVPDLESLEKTVQDAKAAVEGKDIQSTSLQNIGSPSKCSEYNDRDGSMVTPTNPNQENVDISQSKINHDDLEISSIDHKRKAMEQLAYAQAELEARRRCASLAFIELLFWKGASVAEAVANEYNWRRAIDAGASGKEKKKGKSGDLGEDDIEPDYQLGFASYMPRTKPGHFSAEQEELLIEAFERYNGRKDCLDLLVVEMNNSGSSGFKKAHISRKLKELGLRKGRFTESQDKILVDLLYLYENETKSGKFELIARDLGAGFSARQVQRRLRDIGAIGMKRNGIEKNEDASKWDALLGSDDDINDENEGMRNMKQKSDEDLNSSDEDNTSDDEKLSAENIQTIPNNKDGALHEGIDKMVDLDTDVAIETVSDIQVPQDDDKRNKKRKSMGATSDDSPDLDIDLPSSVAKTQDEIHEDGRDHLGSQPEENIKSTGDDASIDDDLAVKRMKALEALRNKKQKPLAGPGQNDEMEKGGDSIDALHPLRPKNSTSSVDLTLHGQSNENVDLFETSEPSEYPLQERNFEEENQGKQAGKTFGRRLKKVSHHNSQSELRPSLDITELEDF